MRIFLFAGLVGCGKGLDAYSSLAVDVKDGQLVVDVAPPGPRCPTLRSDVRATVNGKAMTRTDRGGDPSCNFNAASVNCSGATFELSMLEISISKPIRIELADGTRTVTTELSSIPREDMVEVVSPKSLVGLSPNAEIQIRVRPGVGRWAQVDEHPRFGKKDAKDIGDYELVHFERKSDTEGVVRLSNVQRDSARVLALSKAGNTEVTLDYEVERTTRCEGIQYCSAPKTKAKLVVPVSFR